MSRHFQGCRLWALICCLPEGVVYLNGCVCADCESIFAGVRACRVAGDTEDLATSCCSVVRELPFRACPGIRANVELNQRRLDLSRKVACSCNHIARGTASLCRQGGLSDAPCCEFLLSLACLEMGRCQMCLQSPRPQQPS